MASKKPLLRRSQAHYDWREISGNRSGAVRAWRLGKQGKIRTDVFMRFNLTDAGYGYSWAIYSPAGAAVYRSKRDSKTLNAAMRAAEKALFDYAGPWALK